MSGQPFLAELIGTCILVTLGNGVVANVVLAKPKAAARAGLSSPWGGAWRCSWPCSAPPRIAAHT